MKRYILLASLMLGGCVTTKPIVDTGEVAEKEVVDRYIVKVAFSDYTYSNGSWNDILYTAADFNDAYDYVVEYSSAHSDLIIYDLETGERVEETP